MIRTAHWYFKGILFLESINPYRYQMKTDSFLEGMATHYVLWDKEENKQFGYTIEIWNPSGNFSFVRRTDGVHSSFERYIPEEMA